MAQNYKAGLIITGDASGGIRAIKATEDELSKLNRGFDRSSRDSRRFGSDAQRAGQQVRGMGDNASHASKGLTLVRQAATLAAAAFSIRQLATYADGWSEINARVLNATKSQDVSEHTMKRLAETARGTYSSLNQTAEAYLNNATTLTELGYSTERQLDLADALNNSLVISATRGQQAESVVNALSKAFADGELRGDNFNTVIQSGGRVAEALADGLGVTTIQLREMAAAGELTTSRVFEALTSQMGVLRDEADAMAATIEDGWTLIGNASLELVGRVDQAFGASEGIAGVMVSAADTITESIEPLIDNMGTIQDVAVLTATVVAGNYAAAFASSAKKVAANTAQTVANTRANVAATAAARTKAAEVLRVAQAEQAAAARALANGHAIAAATGNTTLRSKAITQMATANQRAIAAEAAHTAAVNANSAAMQRSTASAYAMAAASRAANGALALIGGPMGAAILAGTAAYYFRDSLGFTSAAARETKQDIDQLVDSLENYTRAQYESNRVSIVQKLAEARIEAEKLESQLASLEGQRSDQGTRYQGGSQSVAARASDLNAKLLEQRRIIATSEEGLREYDQTWQDVLKSQISGVSIYRTLDQWLMTTGDSVNENARRFNALGDTLGENGEKWDDYIGKLRAARDVMGMTAAESAQYAAAQQGYTGLYADQAAAVAGQTDALSDYQKAIADGDAVEAQAHLARAQRYAEAEAMVQAQLQNIGTLTNLLQGVQTELSAVALSAALVVGDSSGAVAANVASAIQAINNRAAAIRNTTTVTVKNTAANREAAAAAREAEQAAKAQADALESIREEMDPLIRDHKTYMDRVNVLEMALAAGTITQTEFGEAIRWSAEQYTRAASGAEDYEQQTESLVGKYDALNQRAQTLRTELDQIRQRYQTGAITGAQYARMLGNVQNEMDQLARESEDAGDSISHSFTTWGTVADNTLRSVDDSGRDAWRGLIDGSTSALDTVKRGFQQTLAEIAHMLTTQKLTFHVAGMMGLDTAGMPGSRGGMNLGSLKNGWDTVSGLWGGGKTAATTAAGYGATGWAGSATGAYGGWAGNAAAGAAQAGSGFMGAASAAMPWIGAGLLADNVLGLGITDGIVKGLFGGSWKTKDAGLNLGVSGGDITGNQYERQRKSGGLFSSSKSRTRTSALDGELEAMLQDAYGAQEAALAVTLETLGQQADALNSFSSGLTKISTKGLSEAEVEQAVQDWLQGIVNNAARSVVDPAQYARAGETTVETLNRLATALTGVNPLLEQLHDTTLAASLAGGAAANHLLELAGGLESFSTRADYYYQNVLTEAERQERALAQAARAMGAFTARTGRVVESTAALRELVDGIDLTTESGRMLYDQAMLLAPALVEVENGLERVGQRFEQVLADATAAISDAESDVRRAWQAFDNQSFQQQITLLEMAGDSTAVLALQRERELASIDPLLHETQRVIWLIEDEAAAKQNAAQAAQNYVSELSRVRDQLSSTFGNIAQWVDQRNATAGAPGVNLAEAGDQFARQLVLAQSGDRNALQSITQYADQYLAAGEAMFASGGAFQRIQSDVLDALQSLPEQISAEEFLAAEFRDALQSVVISAMPTDQRLATQLSSEMQRLGARQLTAAQVRTVLAPHATDAEIERLIRRVDTNGDGIISEQELIAGRIGGLAHGIGSALAPMFDAIDLDASGLIDWNEFYSVFAGMASDDELRRIFDKLDADGSGQISRLEALKQSTAGTEGNTKSLEERARDQLASLNGVTSEMARTTDQFVGLNSNIVSLRDSINALGVAQEEVARIERERAAAERAERDRVERERQAAQLVASGQYTWERINHFDDLAASTAQHANGNVDKYRGYSWITMDEGAFADRIASWNYDSRMAAWTARRLEFGEGHRRELDRLRDQYQNLVGSAAPFALGGVFEGGRAAANSIVSRPTYFDMGLMGEADPEAIMPLSRGAGGRLGVDATGLMRLPEGPLALPPPDLPMPQYPLLDQRDQAQAWRDLLQENKQLRRDVTRLLERIERQGAASVAVQQEGFKQQINEQRRGNAALEDMSTAARLEESRR